MDVLHHPAEWLPPSQGLEEAPHRRMKCPLVRWVARTIFRCVQATQQRKMPDELSRVGFAVRRQDLTSRQFQLIAGGSGVRVRRDSHSLLEGRRQGPVTQGFSV